MAAQHRTYNRLARLARVAYFEIDSDIENNIRVHWDDAFFEGKTLAEAVDKAWRYWKSCGGE